MDFYLLVIEFYNNFIEFFFFSVFISVSFIFYAFSLSFGIKYFFFENKFKSITINFSMVKLT